MWHFLSAMVIHDIASVVCKMLLVVIAMEHHPRERRKRQHKTLRWNRTAAVTK